MSRKAGLAADMERYSVRIWGCPRVCVCECVFLQRENTSLLFRLDRQGIPFWVTRVTLCGDV